MVNRKGKSEVLKTIKEKLATKKGELVENKDCGLELENVIIDEMWTCPKCKKQTSYDEMGYSGVSCSHCDYWECY